MPISSTSTPEAVLVGHLRRRLALSWLVGSVGCCLTFLAVTFTPLHWWVVMLPFAAWAKTFRPKFAALEISAVRVILLLTVGALVIGLSFLYLAKDVFWALWGAIACGAVALGIVSELRLFYSPLRFLKPDVR